MPKNQKELIEATQKAIRIRLIIIPLLCILLAFLNIIPLLYTVFIFIFLMFLTFLLYLTIIYKKGMFEMGFLSVALEVSIISWLLWYSGIQYYFFFAVFAVIILGHTILESRVKGLFVTSIVVVTYISLYIANNIGAGEPFATLDISALTVIYSTLNKIIS